MSDRDDSDLLDTDARLGPPSEHEQWFRREIMSQVRSDWTEVNEIVRVVFARTHVERGGIVKRLFDYADEGMVEVRGEPLAFEVRLAQ